MRALATAVLAGQSYSAKRCEAHHEEGGYALRSPRNSTFAAIVPVQRAEALARHILDTVPSSGPVVRRLDAAALGFRPARSATPPRCAASPGEVSEDVPPRAPKGWRWGLGSADLEGDRVVALSLNGRPIWAQDVSRGGVLERDHVPNFDDPATLGCLEALVREAWRDPGLSSVTASFTHERGYQYRVVEGHHHGSIHGHVEQVVRQSRRGAHRRAGGRTVTLYPVAGTPLASCVPSAVLSARGLVGTRRPSRGGVMWARRLASTFGASSAAFGARTRTAPQSRRGISTRSRKRRAPSRDTGVRGRFSSWSPRFG